MNQTHKKELLKILVKITNEKQMEEFVHDLLTPGEFKDAVKRLQIIKQIKEKVPHRKIAKNLKVGIAKVSRGSRFLKDKRNKGFRRQLKI